MSLYENKIKDFCVDILCIILYPLAYLNRKIKHTSKRSTMNDTNVSTNLHTDSLESE